MTAVELVIAASFWLCLAGVGYTYVAYPVVISVLAAAFGRRRGAPSSASGPAPRVSILIVAHNEEAWLEA
jgi:hypothetical protein